MGTMLDSLKFVRGSIAKKDFVPALKHFVIEDGHVRGFNGTLALSSPIPFDVACKPRADDLIKAIGNCSDVVQLSLTPAGRLTVKSGKFKVHIECVQGGTPHAVPEGDIVHFDGAALLEGLKVVAPFIGDDASRRWANGVLFENQCLMATNNVTLVQYWVGFNFPSVVNIPREAVKEMLRINEPPLYAQVSESSVTFNYENDRWLRTQLFDSLAWPDIESILNRENMQQPINEQIFEGLDVLKPFVDKMGSVYFSQGKMTTHTDDADGGSFELDMPFEGRYNIDMLKLLQGAAESIDWSTYPTPCVFMGGRLRGVIIGMKM